MTRSFLLGCLIGAGLLALLTAYACLVAGADSDRDAEEQPPFDPDERREQLMLLLKRKKEERQ